MVRNCNYYGMFMNCPNVYLYSANIDNGNCSYMFANCPSVTTGFTTGWFNNVSDCSHMFEGCSNMYEWYLNSGNIPASVLNAYNMFAGTMLEGRINILANSLPRNFVGFLNGRKTNTQGQIRLNIWCNSNQFQYFNGTSAANSITGTAITWTTYTNWAYNDMYNIRIYRNFPY